PDAGFDLVAQEARDALEEQLNAVGHPGRDLRPDEEAQPDDDHRGQQGAEDRVEVHGHAEQLERAVLGNLDVACGQDVLAHLPRSFMTGVTVVARMMIWNAARPRNTPKPSGFRKTPRARAIAAMPSSRGAEERPMAFLLGFSLEITFTTERCSRRVLTNPSP